MVEQDAHNVQVTGSNPVPRTKILNAHVAQLVERLICNQDVVGSNPILGSKLRSLILKLNEKVLDKAFFSCDNIYINTKEELI